MSDFKINETAIKMSVGIALGLFAYNMWLRPRLTKAA